METHKHLTATAGAALLAFSSLSSAGADAATLTVGPGASYATIGAAVAASQDGDTISVQPGTYTNDFAEISTNITLQPSGSGRVHMKAVGQIPNGKGILITDTDVTITGFTFSGASISAANGGNGAGVRYQGGNLVLTDCYFYGNQDGLLSNPDPTGSITINASEFYHNGVATGSSSGYTHNLYVGQIATLDIENSYFHDAVVGHEIKSRALSTVVNGTRIVESPTGTASYSIDLPNGGTVSIINDQIQQGQMSENPVMISYGEEGGVYAGSSLSVQNSVISNLLVSPSATGVANASPELAQVIGNQIWGLTNSQIATGPTTLADNSILSAAPTIATGHPWAATTR